jgi:hypothetical protein
LKSPCAFLMLACGLQRTCLCATVDRGGMPGLGRGGEDTQVSGEGRASGDKGRTV